MCFPLVLCDSREGACRSAHATKPRRLPGLEEKKVCAANVQGLFRLLPDSSDGEQGSREEDTRGRSIRLVAVKLRSELAPWHGLPGRVSVVFLSRATGP